MATVTVCGNALVITSAATMAELKTLAKLRPDALVLRGGENNKSVLFRVATGDPGDGEITALGAVFDGVTHDEQKKATITIPDFTPCGDVKQAVYDQYGGAIVLLNKLEESWGTVHGEIAAEKQGVMNAISCVQ